MSTHNKGSVWVLGVIFRLTLSPMDSQSTICPVLSTKNECDSFVPFVGKKNSRLGQEKAGEVKIQECFYNRWKHDHYMSTGFMFTSDGMTRLM
eukprot:11467284-Ditylum_brightwellii.AAC.1